MEKKIDYLERLNEVFEHESQQEHEWGKHDCFTFCVDAVKAMTGEDLMENITYKNQKEALKIIKDAGSSKALISKHLGEPINAAFAQAGDICLLAEDTKVFEGLSYIDGGEILLVNIREFLKPGVMSHDCKHVIVRSERGLMLVRREFFSDCWRV